MICPFMFLALCLALELIAQTHNHPLNRNTKPIHPLEKGFLRADFFNLGKFKLKPKPKDAKIPREIGDHYIKNQIPVEILRLRGKKVQIEGFIFPIEVEGYKMKSGVLLRNPMSCHFHRLPRLNEIVMVRLEGSAVEISSMRVCVVWGELDMGDEVYELNKGGAIYSIKASKVMNVR